MKMKIILDMVLKRQQKEKPTKNSINQIHSLIHMNLHRFERIQNQK